MWIVIDLILAAVIIGFAVNGFKKGFIKSLLGLGVSVIAVAITMNTYPIAANWLRDTVIYEQLTEKLNGKIQEYLANGTNNDNVSQLFSDAPSQLNDILSSFGFDSQKALDKFNEFADKGTDAALKGLADYIVEPAAKTLSNAVAIIVVFLLSVLLLTLVIRILDLIFKLPVLNFANRLGGLIVGLAAAFIVSSIICTATSIALPYIEGAGINITEQQLSRTLLFSNVSKINPFSFLLK